MIYIPKTEQINKDVENDISMKYTYIFVEENRVEWLLYIAWKECSKFDYSKMV